MVLCKSQINHFERLIDKYVKDLENENQIIDKIISLDDNTVETVELTHEETTRVKALLNGLQNKMINKNDRIKILHKKILLLHFIEEYLVKNNYVFKTIKQLYNYIRTTYDIGEFSIGTLYRLVKIRGLRFKTTVVRQY